MRKYLAADLKRIRSRNKEFQSLSRDPWIKANSEIEAQRLHALGVITFRWNLCEQKLLGLFAALLDFPESEVMALSHELSDFALIIRIRALAANRLADDQNLLAAVTNALEVYEVCRQNRNQLTHFAIVITFGRRKTGYLPDWDFQRREKNPFAYVKMPFRNALTDLRHVAKDIQRLNVNLARINDHVDRKCHPERRRPLRPSPKILPLPAFLSKPLRPSRKERMRPPRSSRG